jgi:hypothetical protein
MAYVDLSWIMKITVIDNGANESSVTFEMTAATHLLAVIDAAIVLSAFEAVCAAGTVMYSLSQQSVNDSLVIPASAAVQVEAKALYTMRDSANPTKRHSKRIPAPETDVFLATSGDGANIMDVAHQDNIDLANLFGTSGVCTISDGETIEDDALLKGRRVTHSSRRG